MTTVKALACELPTRREEPLSRYSTADLARLIAAHPERPAMRASTIWRVLDRYAGWWEGQPRDRADCVISADEKTSIQARARRHV